MVAFWRTEDGHLRIGVLVLLALLCGGTIYDLVVRHWDAKDMLVLPLFIVGMTAIATARRKMPTITSTSERLRSPLYAAGVLAVMALCGILAYDFIWGFIEGYRNAAGASATVQQ